LGLIVLYIVYLVKRGQHQAAAGQKKEYQIYLLMTLGASAVFFVAIPFAIYVLSYIPYATANGQPLSAGGLLSEMWSNQKYMLYYHASQMVDVSQAFQSRWYEWIFDIKPTLYYSRFQVSSRTVFAAFTNPLVTIGGLAALLIALRDFLRKRAKEPFVIVVGYLAQLAPWILVKRITYAYHYFPSMVFLTLAICYVFNNIFKLHPSRKRRVYVFVGVSMAIFFLLLPPTAGLQMPNWYSAWFVRWLPSWHPF
jgi:dolichyl-phosphate-mannose--protein O-mannosyl transferase